MAVYDQVDPVDLPRHARRHILGGEPRSHRIVRRHLVQPRMQQDHHHIRLLSLHCSHGAAHGPHDVAHRQSSRMQVITIPQHRPRGGSTDNRNAHPLPLYQGVGRHKWSAARVAHVGRHKRKRRFVDRGPQCRYAVIELMVAKHRRVVPHDVHGGDHRMDRRRGNLGGHIQQRVPRQNVAPLH